MSVQREVIGAYRSYGKAFNLKRTQQIPQRFLQLLKVEAENKLEAIQRYDKLAASPLDPGRITAGVSWKEFDASSAKQACSQAVEAEPDSARLQFQYGRSLHKRRQYADAMKWYRARPQNRVTRQLRVIWGCCTPMVGGCKWTMRKP